jgi:hypothetical protein
VCECVSVSVSVIDIDCVCVCLCMKIKRIWCIVYIFEKKSFFGCGGFRGDLHFIVEENLCNESMRP